MNDFLFFFFYFASVAIVTAYETNTQHDPNNNNAMLGVHASASAIIQYGKIGRKQVGREGGDGGGVFGIQIGPTENIIEDDLRNSSGVFCSIKDKSY